MPPCTRRHPSAKPVKWAGRVWSACPLAKTGSRVQGRECCLGRKSSCRAGTARYSQENRAVEVICASCLWRHPGKTPVPIRYVLVRDPTGQVRYAGSPMHESVRRPRADSRMVRHSDGRWRRPSKRCEPTWESKHSGSGLILAIARTTPALMGLFSLDTRVAAHRLEALGKLTRADAAWYHKESAHLLRRHRCRAA